MISNEVTLFPVDQIKVDWSVRREVDESHIADLADSIQKLGLIHTILISPDGELTVGGHRLQAWLQLRSRGVPCRIPEYEGWSKIPARIAEDFTPEELARIELIENLQHRKLDWKEEVKAIWRLHQLQKEQFGEDYPAQGTADLLGVQHHLVTRPLAIFPHLDDPDIAEATTITKAWNILQRKMQRQKAEVFEKVMRGGGIIDVSEVGKPREKSKGTPDGEVPGEVSKVVAREVTTGGAAGPSSADPSAPVLSPSTSPDAAPSPILAQSFEDFAATYDGPRFNFIHCDFPYGINLTASAGQNSARDRFEYDDSPEVYWSLLETLATHKSSLLSSSCHILFWFSQNLRRETEDFFRKHLPEFKIEPFLMIWHRTDNAGLLPDPQRYGRRNYETAMLLTSGDRLLARKAKSLCYGYGDRSDTKIHRSQKPLPVLFHFFEMFVDETTKFLDPTCGSGTSIRVAHDLGAEVLVGVEKDPEIAHAAFDAFLSHTRS